MRPLRLLQLILLSLQSLTVCTADKDNNGELQSDEEFTKEQLERAKESLSKLFDGKLDSNRDGKVTRQELIAWLAAANRQLAERDLDEAWMAYNLTLPSPEDKAESHLDWETHVARRAAGAEAAEESAVDAQQGKQQQQQAEFHAEVKRAIEYAAKETGIDKAGIKVGVPELPTVKPKTTKSDETGKPHHAQVDHDHSSEEQQQQQQRLALELGRDRRRWDAADDDGDGRLSRREFGAFALAEGFGTPSPAMRRVLALEALERLDSDGDGRVSLAEFLAGAPQPIDSDNAAAAKEDAKNFRDVWDVDKDGYMDSVEMEKMLDYLSSAGSQGKEGQEADEAAEEAAEEADRLIRSADADGDSSLSKTEVLAALREFTGSVATDYGGSVGIHDEL